MMNTMTAATTVVTAVAAVGAAAHFGLSTDTNFARQCGMSLISMMDSDPNALASLDPTIQNTLHNQDILQMRESLKELRARIQACSSSDANNAEEIATLQASHDTLETALTALVARLLKPLERELLKQKETLMNFDTSLEDAFVQLAQTRATAAKALALATNANQGMDLMKEASAVAEAERAELNERLSTLEAAGGGGNSNSVNPQRPNQASGLSWRTITYEQVKIVADEATFFEREYATLQTEKQTFNNNIDLQIESVNQKMNAKRTNLDNLLNSAPANVKAQFESSRMGSLGESPGESPGESKDD